MKKFLLFSVLILSVNLAADLTEDLVGYYPFGGNADDLSGNGNHGTVIGAELTADRFGNEDGAYLFNDGDKITVNISGSGNWSLSCWVNVYPNSENAQLLTDSPTTSTRIAQHLFTNRYGMTEYGVDDYIFSGGSNTVYDQWVMLTYICTSGNSYFYLNDVYIGSISRSFDFEITCFGSDLSEEDTMHGSLDEMRIYNRALSSDDIEELYFQADFTAPAQIYAGETVQFTDNSTGNPTSWFWDFENDGVYDAYVQNPNHVYSSPGIYSIKLKTMNNAFSDSLVKIDAITVDQAPPAAPDSTWITLDHPDATVSWSAVDTTIYGYPVTPDGYIVLYNELPDEEHFWFLSFTTDTTYTHAYVAQYRDQMFYKVVAIKDNSPEQVEYLNSLSNSNQKIGWDKLRKYLSKKAED